MRPRTGSGRQPGKGSAPIGADHVHRVNQLDALELDAECRSHVWSSLVSLLPVSVVDRFGPELRCSLAAFVFAATLSRGASSPGQLLQNLKPAPASSASLATYIAAEIVAPYVWERVQRWRRFAPDRQMLGAAQLVKVINLVLFLYGAAYRTLPERIAGVTYAYRRARVSRQIAFDFMNQELIWAGASDFLLFIVPLLNTRRMRLLVWRLIGLRLGRASSSPATGATSCGICRRLDPICVPSVASCGHVFCYYCLKGSRLADPEFRCPTCDQTITSQADGWRLQDTVAG